MAVRGEALRLVRMLGGKAMLHRQYKINSVRPTRTESQKLAEAMRRLPGHYADRLAPRALRRITVAAAAGQWERAVDQLITALRFGSAPVTAGERDELRAVLTALGMPGERVDALTAQHQNKGSAAHPAGPLLDT
ncbi:MAG: hypothetical protein QOE54_4349 [Streptosporangiaceae bacterium]|jgi:hypothetical protein|nr:hypothetical protein [Streptosporangiaceae bacterium]MDX6431983.1 hypothetical protein [Streptosporangiaceae bacterium]